MTDIYTRIRSFRQVKIIIPDFNYSMVFADQEMRPRVSEFAARLGGVQLVEADVEDIGITECN